MRFGPVRAADAAGAVLAHTHRLPGRGVLKKGRRLSPEDVARLAAAGVDPVVVAQLEPDDVREDDAAYAVATAVAGAGLRVAEPSTGRANLHALAAGVLLVDAARVDAVNRVDEAITLGTLAPFVPVAAGEMVATVKVIPFAVPRSALDGAVAAADGPALTVAPFRPLRAGLALTRLPGVGEPLLDRAAAAQRARVARLGGTLAEEHRCAHETGALADALRALLAHGAELVLVMGASAIVDRADVVPSAVVAVGGRVVHLGMPVDPGNLLLLAEAPGPTGHAVPVVGVPGCARSLKESGFDRVLARLAAGLEVGPRAIQGMGVGGLLKEIAARPQPREAPPAVPAVVDGEVRPRRVAGVVLAAGLSRRMGPANKLLVPVEGAPMVARAVDALREAGADPVVVVLGHEAERVRAALAGRDVRFAENPAFADGMSTSLRAGVAALADDAVDAAVVSLGDMPWVRAAHVRALVEAFDPEADRSICVPVHARKRGNPVLFAARYFPEMARLEGDVGARALLDAHADQIALVPVDDPGIHLDVDTPDALPTGDGAPDR